MHALQIGRVDRPSVYRALAQLEADGLVRSAAQRPVPRRADASTRSPPQGEQVLRRWMGVIKQERDGLDRVLRRYVATGTVDAVLAEVEGGWHTVTATSWSPVSPTSRIERGHGSLARRPQRPNRAADIGDDALGRRRRSRHDAVGSASCADRSAVMINARSSVGPITFGAIGVTGFIEAAVAGRRVCPPPQPTAHLEIDVEQPAVGQQPLRRRTAPPHRRPPPPDGEPRPAGLHRARARVGDTSSLGEVTFHGVSRPLDGTVSLAMPSDRRLVVRGEQVVDIRDFGIASPTVLMLRIYPDVVVGLQVEAELERQT